MPSDVSYADDGTLRPLIASGSPLQGSGPQKHAAYIVFETGLCRDACDLCCCVRRHLCIIGARMLERFSQGTTNQAAHHQDMGAIFAEGLRQFFC